MLNQCIQTCLDSFLSTVVIKGKLACCRGLQTIQNLCPCLLCTKTSTKSRAAVGWYDSMNTDGPLSLGKGRPAVVFYCAGWRALWAVSYLWLCTIWMEPDLCVLVRALCLSVCLWFWMDPHSPRREGRGHVLIHIIQQDYLQAR